MNAYEYIHEKSYVHCDMKGTNLLLGEAKGTENNVYLVDFGLACKYPSNFSPDPKKMHNGTLEYTSRDAHNGGESIDKFSLYFFAYEATVFNYCKNGTYVVQSWPLKIRLYWYVLYIQTYTYTLSEAWSGVNWADLKAFCLFDRFL